MGGGQTAYQQVSNFSFVPVAPPVLSPVLSIVKSGASSYTLSWPGGAATNLVLQQSSSLTGPWVNVSATPVLVGSQYQVMTTSTSDTQFFRLSSAGD